MKPTRGDALEVQRPGRYHGRASASGVSASSNASAISNTRIDAEAILQQADTAMYEAKKAPHRRPVAR